MQWDKSGYKIDKLTFLFSFNRKEKYTARNDNNSIKKVFDEGPRFGHGYPEIYLLYSLDKGRSWDSPNCTFIQERYLTNGEEFWDVKQLEVFKIQFI